MRWYAIALLGALAACASSPSAPATEVSIPEDTTLRLADIGKACTGDSPATLLDPALRDAIPVAHRERHRSSDSVWVALAKEIPGGVGGIFREGSEDFLFLVDPSKRAEAIAALAATSTGKGLMRMGFRLHDVTVLKARWDFAQLAEWYAYVFPRAIDGVAWSSADIQEASNQLQFFVINETERSKLEANLRKLDLPCNLIAIGIRDYAVPL